MDTSTPGYSHHAMPDRVPVLIVARPGRMRAGLCALLRMIPMIELVGQVDHGLAAPERVTQARPALVLLDSSLPFAEMELALRQIKTEWPQTRCIVVADNIPQQGLAQAAGADGVLLKGFATETLFTTIDEVLARIARPSGRRSAE